MATYKRDSSDNIYDEKGNIINKRKKKTDNQISMNFDENNDFVIDSSVGEENDVVDESGLPVTFDKNEIILWDEAKFYDNFEHNADYALKMILSIQSNDNPLKKGGEDIGFRCDSIIFKNRQQYSPAENTIFDIITGVISTNPDDNAYKIYIKDIVKHIGYNDEKYIYRILKKDFDKLKKKPLLIDIPGNADDAEPMEISWWLLCDYNSAEDCKKKGKPDNAHIVIIPTPFFKLLTLSSTIMHGAHYSIEISSSIIGKYARNLYYILESRKKYRAYPDAVPGVFTFTLEELQNLLTYPSSYRATDVRRRILDEAKEEINNLPNSDIQFDYELLKTGKSFTHVRFHVYDIYDTAKIEQNDLSNQKEIIDVKDNTVVGLLKGFGFSDKDIEKIYVVYDETNSDIKKLTAAITKTFESSDIKSKTSYLCKLLQNGLYKEQPAKSKNTFNNFNQRDVDNDELEKILLK